MTKVTQKETYVILSLKAILKYLWKRSHNCLKYCVSLWCSNVNIMQVSVERIADSISAAFPMADFRPWFGAKELKLRSSALPEPARAVKSLLSLLR